MTEPLKPDNRAKPTAGTTGDPVANASYAGSRIRRRDRIWRGCPGSRSVLCFTAARTRSLTKAHEGAWKPNGILSVLVSDGAVMMVSPSLFPFNRRGAARLGTAAQPLSLCPARRTPNVTARLALQCLRHASCADESIRFEPKLASGLNWVWPMSWALVLVPRS